ncbi:MAG: GspE/PulE family protein, partial [Armatimonadota bacterium]
MSNNLTQENFNWGTTKKFRLVIREQGSVREMGGNEMSVAVNIVDTIMMQALDLGSSDVHLQPERDQFRMRYRQDGILHDAGQLPPEHLPNVLARLKLAAGMRIDEHREPQDGRIDMEYNGRRLAARASCIPCLSGEKFVMRILDPMAMKVELNQLGIGKEVSDKWQRVVNVPYGLILVTGPTGSGKTSTLYASLNLLDHKRKNIVTVEDPVEYEFDANIAQVQVTEKLTFPKVMRSFLRQDPDIMMVGEMRDAESLQIGIQASLTGHLVLSTLHTNSALESVGRMMDMGCEPFYISAVTVGIMAQRLVRRTCSQCAEPFEYPQVDLEACGISVDEARSHTLMRGRGCDNCRGLGFKGRVGVYELIVGNRSFKEAVAHKASYPELLAVARQQGFKTMLEDGKDKILQGVTTPDEVM